MDGRGGCCIARYAGCSYDMSKVDRIMLRFRPIAPKPAVGGSVSDGSTPGKRKVSVKAGRGKRRYVRDGNSFNKKCNNRKRKGSPEETDPFDKNNSGGSVSGGETAVTLPLLPEEPDPKDSLGGASSGDHSDVTVTIDSVKNVPIWLSFDNSHPVNDGHLTSGFGHVASRTDRTVVMIPQPIRLVGSYVTVECVTETWVDGYGLGSTDKERVMNLERDACPGFISDCLNSVKWANGAYREEMLFGPGQVDGGDVMRVRLVIKDGVSLPEMCPAFTCRLKVVTCGKERSSVTVPCDVWRMEGGGFAWRLDVKAALCLGR
ncbi:unnamed protein product [Ilex paraguariensis]|uniref:DUF7950 domain-containing protein n=1 Tax=Ilex paraguariensis TaxID=185542 RepID=M9ZMD3_9AQUA|nr:hypothetical protein [Ilex paraguariensis]